MDSPGSDMKINQSNHYPGPLSIELSMLLTFMDDAKFEGRVIPVKFKVYLYWHDCHIAPEPTFVLLRDGKFNQIKNHETKDLVINRPNHYTKVIKDFSLKLFKQYKLLISPVAETHIRLLMTERCLDKALVHQERISYSLFNDLYTTKTRGNANANFHKWLSKKNEALSNKIKELSAHLD